jgi:Fe-S-cluster containining protein
MSENKIVQFGGFQDRELLSKVRSYIDTAAANEVILSTGFFRGFGCPAGCGACCSTVSLDFIKNTDRWELFQVMYPEKVEKFKEHTTPEGVEVMSYSNTDHGGKKCSFLDMNNGRCTVHEAAPLPCRIAPVKFIDKRVSSNKVYLNASAYGRAWAFTQIDGVTKGAMCEILGFDYNKFLNDLEMLKELREYAIKLGIPTKLKYIIDFLELHKEEFRLGNLPKVNIVFEQENIL